MAIKEEKAKKSPVKKKKVVDPPARKAKSVQGENNIDSRTEEENDLPACEAESVAVDTNLSKSRKRYEKVNAKEEAKKATDQAKTAGSKARSLKGSTAIERPKKEKDLSYGKAKSVAGDRNVSKRPKNTKPPKDDKLRHQPDSKPKPRYSQRTG